VNRLLIVDGHAYAYRAFHAIRDLRGPEGRPTNGIYGFIKMLEKLRAGLEPAALMVVWDGGLSAERMAALPEYKMHRPEMPDDLRPQLDEMVAYLAAAGVPSYRGEGIEADDYIACLARQAAAAAWNVVIASSDKDFMQLVSERIGLWNPNDKVPVVWTREQVLAKSGVEPEQVADWLALMGDAVDNIPGVPGVGPKTAKELIKKFGSVKGIYENIAADPKLQKRLGPFKKEAELAEELVTLERNAPIEIPALAALGSEQEPASVRPYLEKMGFATLLKRIEGKEKPNRGVQGAMF